MLQEDVVDQDLPDMPDGVDMGEGEASATFRLLGGRAMSVAAKRTVSLLIGVAAGEPWPAAMLRISRRALCAVHGRGREECGPGGEDLGAWLDEAAGLRMALRYIDRRGRPITLRAGLFSLLAVDDEGDRGEEGDVVFAFHPAARRFFGTGTLAARLNCAALLALRGRYAVTLYELGSRLVRQGRGAWTGPLATLCGDLGICPDLCRDWPSLCRFALAPAAEEIASFAHFSVAWAERCRPPGDRDVELRFEPLFGGPEAAGGECGAGSGNADGLIANALQNAWQ